MNHFDVHDAIESDLPQIALISWKTWKRTGVFTGFQGLSYTLRDPDRELLVVRNDRGYVIAYGFIRYDKDTDVCFQPGTAVREDMREPGAAAAINAERYRRAQARGYRAIRGYIIKTNHASLDYRLREGWTVVGDSPCGRYNIVEYEFPKAEELPLASS